MGYDLDWWLEALLPALDQFVQASLGKPDIDFWMSLCHINTGTSFPVYEPLTGWVQVFFPYLIHPGDSFDRFAETSDGKKKMQMRRNTALDNYLESYKSKMTSAKLEGKKFPASSLPKTRGGFSFGGDSEPSGVKYGVKLENFPPAMSSAPFTYKDANTKTAYFMAFMGGITTLVQHADTEAIEPTMGWAVMDSGKSAPFLN